MWLILLHVIFGNVLSTSFFPGDEQYLDSIAGNGNACPLRCPDEVVLPADSVEVALTMQRAFRNNHSVNVRCGGHSMWCQWAQKDGILIDMRSLHAHEFIPGETQNLVRVQGGATFDVVIPELVKNHNVIISHGLSPGVGMGGIYTGGGWHLFLTGAYGWAVDNIVGFTLVTPGGSLVSVNATGTFIVQLSPLEPNLAEKIAGNWLNWAAKGTWSSFGIITEFLVPAHPYPEPWMQFRVIDPWSQDDNLFTFISNPPDSWSCGSFGLGIWGFDDVQAIGCTKLDPADNRTMLDVLRENKVETIGALPLSPKVFEICEGRHGGILLGLGYVVAAEKAPQVMKDIALWKECLNGHAFQGGGRFGLQSKTALPWPNKAVFVMIAPINDNCARKLINFTNMQLKGAWNGSVHVYPNWGDCGIADFGHAYWGHHYEELVTRKRQWDPQNKMSGIQTVGADPFETCWQKADPSPNCATAKATQRKFNKIWDTRVKQCKENTKNVSILFGNPEPCITSKKVGLTTYTCLNTSHRNTKFVVNIPNKCMRDACGLIIDVHGGAMNPDWEEKNTGLRAQGEVHGYIVLNPSTPGIERPDSHDDPDVYRIMHELIDVYGVDKNRLHITGFSYGGDMTWRFFKTYSEEFASIAPLGACELTSVHQLPPTQIPILHFAGHYDALVSFRTCERSVKVLQEGWAMDNGTVIDHGNNFTRTRYINSNQIVFDFVQFDYVVGICGPEPYPFLGHCFPGSPDQCGTPFVSMQLSHLSCPGHHNVSFVAGQEIMKFFLAHPKQT